MMTRSKKIISAAMAMCLAVSMTPMINGTAYAGDLQAADFMVQEFSNFTPNSSLTEKDLAGITYDSKTKTITLNNVNLTKSLGDKDWFEVDSNVTINLVGNNKFTNKNGRATSCLFNCLNNATITGSGSITVTGMGFVMAENINVKSGKIDITSPHVCLLANNNINIAGNAKLSAATKDKNNKYEINCVISAEKMTNSYKSLVKVVGSLPKGAEIKDKNAIYKVIDDEFNVKMTQWVGGKNAKITGDMTKKIMGGYYNISVIGTDSFNNAAGKKVKKITVYSTGDEPLKIEKYAFRGTKSLTDFYTRIGDIDSNNSLINNEYY